MPAKVATGSSGWPASPGPRHRSGRTCRGPGPHAGPRPSSSGTPAPRPHRARSGVARDARRRGGRPRWRTALVVEAPCPGREPLEPLRARPHRQLGEHPAAPTVDRDGGVGLLVRVDSDYDHPWSPFWTHTPDGEDHRRTRLSGADASSYEVTPAGLRRRRAAQRMKVIPLARDTNPKSQPAVGRRLSRDRSRDLTCVITLTLRHTLGSGPATLGQPRSCPPPAHRYRRHVIDRLDERKETHMFTPAAAVYVAEAIAGSPRKQQPVLLPRSASRSGGARRTFRVTAVVRRRSVPATPTRTLRPRSA